MNSIHEKLIERAGLFGVYEKVCDGTRLSEEDGMLLYACDELPVLSLIHI